MNFAPATAGQGKTELGQFLILAGLFAVAMIPVLVTPVLPLIDFYNHLARFFVLSHIGSSGFLQAHYQAHWALLPDIGVDVLATPLLYILPPLLAGHVIVIAILAIQYGGVLYFHRALTGGTSLLVAVLLLPLLYSYVLNWGFANFLLGLGLAFWAAGWWIRHRARPALAVPVSCVLALLIFFSHGIAFVLYGVLLAMLEIGFFLRAGQRRDDGGGPRRAADLVRALALLSVQAVIPLAYFLLWQGGLAAGGQIDALAAAREPFAAWLARAAYNHLESMLRVEEGPALWFDIATLFGQCAIVGLLIVRGRLSLARPAWLAALVVLLLALVPLPLYVRRGIHFRPHAAVRGLAGCRGAMRATGPLARHRPRRPRRACRHRVGAAGRGRGAVARLWRDLSRICFGCRQDSAPVHEHPGDGGCRQSRDQGPAHRDVWTLAGDPARTGWPPLRR